MYPKIILNIPKLRWWVFLFRPKHSDLFFWGPPVLPTGNAVMTAVGRGGAPAAANGGATGAPAAARGKRHKDRGAKFNEKHALKYGLSVCSRSNRGAAVETVMCKFCVAFGKESAADATRKRRATANIKYFRQPFRADHYLSHLEINHKLKWAEYEHRSDADKEKFFASYLEDAALQALGANAQAMTAAATGGGAAIAAAAAAASHDTSMDELMSASAPPLPVGPVRLPVSEIEKSVVEVLLGEFFEDPTAELGVTKQQALAVFVRKAPLDIYSIVIKNQRLYDLAIKFVSCGASFRLATRMIQCAREETKLAFYGGGSEQKIAGYVRAVIASNLQKIALMMRSSWTYAIATDAAEHQSTFYLDFRVRVWQGGALQDFHLFSLPTFDQHPALLVLQRIQKFMAVMDPNWREKMVGTTTHGGTNTGRDVAMTGSQQGLAARLSKLVPTHGFYLVWCGVHQLDLVVKNCVTAFCHKAFLDELVAVISILRQQKDQEQSSSRHAFLYNCDELPDLLSAYTSTRGFSHVLKETIKWFIDQRVGVMQLLEEIAPNSVPSASWWICVAVMHRIMAEVEYFMTKLEGMENSANLVSEQVQELSKLALILADVAGTRRDVLDSQAMHDACSAGSFLLTLQNAQQFIQNEGGPVSIEMFDQLRGVERHHISKSVGQFVVDVISGVTTIAQDGRHYTAENGGTLVDSPCVLPIEVYEMGKESFLAVLAAQESRLLQTFSADDIKTIAREYDEFVAAVEREPILVGVLKKHGRETDVSFAWSCLNGRFRMLQEFIGGLACVVPEAVPGSMASDLSVLNWEKPDYRQTMVDFALEGILHARQKVKVELVDISYIPPSVASASSTSSPISQQDEAMSSAEASVTSSVSVASATHADVASAVSMTPLGAAMGIGMPLGMPPGVEMGLGPPPAVNAQMPGMGGQKESTNSSSSAMGMGDGFMVV